MCGAAEGDFSAEVFTFELLGDCSMVNFKIDDRVLSVKASKDVRLARGERVGVRCSPGRLYWFDAANGERLRA